MRGVFILGPTCTGKTSFGLFLCQKFNGCIVSADSRQVVKHMDVGTGKVPYSSDRSYNVERFNDRWTINGVDVYGYDLVNPDEYFSAYDFMEFCKKIFPRVSRNGKNIFVVGGTGFYIDVISGNAQVFGVGPNLKLREELENLKHEELAEKLKQINPEVYKKTDLKNKVRIIRAIERSLSNVSESSNIRASLFESAIFVGFTAPRSYLYQSADAWIDRIFGSDLFEEVLFIKKHFPKSSRLNGLIYKSALGHIEGTYTLEESKQRAKFDMHAYIRRQLTWFKRRKDITWFDITKPNFDEDIISLVESETNGR